MQSGFVNSRFRMHPGSYGQSFSGMAQGMEVVGLPNDNVDEGGMSDQFLSTMIRQAQAARSKNTTPSDANATPSVLSEDSSYHESGEEMGDGSEDEKETYEVREKRASPSQSHNGVSSLDKYAFNFDRDAYNHQVPRRLTVGIALNVGKLDGKTSLAQHYEEAATKGQANVCPPLLPLSQEIPKPSSKNSVCIWVGMLPSTGQMTQDNPILLQAPIESGGEGNSRTPAKKRARGSTSIVDLSEEEMNIVPFDPNALRVVAKKSDKITKAWVLYALISPNTSDKICQGFRVEFEKVYFFKAFRDDEAKGFQSRKLAMKEKIKAKIFPALSPPDVGQFPATAPTVKYQQAVNAASSVHKHCPSRQMKRSARHALPDRPAKRLLAIEHHSDTLGALVNQKLTTNSATTRVYALANGKLNDNGSRSKSVLRADHSPTHALDNEELMEDLDFDTMDLDEASSKKTTKGKGQVKSVMFWDEGGQTLDNSRVVRPSSLQRDGVVADDDEKDSPWLVNQQKAANLAKDITKMANKLADQTDIAALRQGLTMLSCLQHRQGPTKASALGLYLNVPTNEDLDPKICLHKLDELFVSIQILVFFI